MIYIPTKDDYHSFVSKFSNELSKSHPDVCFFAYGSFFDGHCDYGRSDVDGGLIFDSMVVTDKKKFVDVAEILASILKQHKIKTGFNPMDVCSAQDGRFLSYSDDYTDFIKEFAKVLSGPDKLYCLNGKNFKAQVLQSASFNFCGPDGVRRNLLYANSFFNEDKDLFVKKVVNSLEKVAKFPKKLLWLRGEKIIPSRFESSRKLEVMLDIDFNQINVINYLLCHPKELFNSLYNQDYAISLLSNSLDFLERMIEAYLKKFEKISPLELKE